MERMRAALRNLADVSPFLPVEPEIRDASRQYGRIFEMMGHHMTTVFGYDTRCHALGILTTNWMLGHPVKRLISSRIRWNKRHGRRESVALTIRKTLEDIEQIARFQAPRYLSCYADIARMVLSERGSDEEAATIPDLTLSLEFGVRGPVQLALMALGLSRSSTIAIADAVASQITAEVGSADTYLSAVAESLRSLDVGALQLPSLIMEEVRQVQGSLMEPDK